MKSITDRLRLITWYQWVLAVCIFLYLIYLSFSWFYLPGKLKQVTETDISRMIGRKISVEKINFNPFTLSLSAMNLSINEKDKTPLISWDQLLVNLGLWRSIFSWGVALDQFSLDKPSVNIVKNKDGFSFDDIIERLSASDPENNLQKGDNSRSISIEIFNISINRGKFAYADISGPVDADFNLDDISLAVDKFYFATGEEHLNPFILKARGEKGSIMQLDGNYRIAPLYVEGNINAEGIEFSNFSGFIENILPIKLSRGILSFTTAILAESDDQLILKTDKGSLSIDNLVVDDDVPEPPMLNAGKINVQDFGVDITGRRVMVEKVLLDTITLNQWIDETGRPRYADLLPKKNPAGTIEKENPAGNNANEETPWNIMVKQVSLKDSAINFEDRNEDITRGHSLSRINIDLRDISLSPESRIAVQLAAILDDRGGVNVEGFLSPSPFSMDLNYHLDKILLSPFSEYLESASWLRIADGSLSIDGKVSISEGPETSIGAAASLDVDDFKLEDSRSGSPVLGLKAFTLDDINAEVEKQNVSIASVTISKPDINLSMSDKKELNLSGLMKEKKVEAVQETPAEPSDKSPGWKFEIEKVSMSDGTLLFSDNSVKPAYKTGLYNMNFSMDRIGSGIKKPALFSFKTEIDKYAPFTVTGTLDPIDRQPGFDFNSMLKGLDMSHLSPYSAVYIGNNLKSGKLSLNLDYTLHDRKLKGKNNINAKNLYLGEKLPVKPVINAPVGLGLALLRDLSGVIDLNVGISGDLDDPGFSVSGVIVKALVNIIVKAAASPFKLLGALIPGGGEDLGNVTFDPGDSALNQENQRSLKNLVDALNKRPQLILSIKGNAGPDDIEALKKAHLKKLVAEKRGVGLSALEEELKTQEFWMIAENRPALKAVNDDMGLTPISQRIEEALPTGDSENQDGTGQDSSVREQTVYKQVYDDIIASWKIGEDELLALAGARTLSIKQYLVDELKLNHERVSEIKPLSSDLSGRVINLELDVM